MTGFCGSARTLIVGVEVGGTKVAALATDTRDQRAGRVTVSTDARGPEGILSSIIDAAHRVVEAAGAHVSNIAAMGLGVPGESSPRLVSSAWQLTGASINEGERRHTQAI